MTFLGSGPGSVHAAGSVTMRQSRTSSREGKATLESHDKVTILGVVANVGIVGSTVTEFWSVTSDVVYDPTVAGNAYLGGLVYDIDEGDGVDGG